jgi:hypothetical protein
VEKRLTADEAHRLLDRLAELSQIRSRKGLDETWRIEKEPHDYPDGTTHFTHVHTTGYVKEEAVTVVIASHVTPDLAEMLVTMRNNLPELLRLARLGLEAEERAQKS